ncbi:MAG: PD-(D/E)XK nuclease family protein [Magnetococcales bacterium]|nr:PD-(D/E)XK nuclease family protein [Magnetococcales bacterium]
MTTLSWNDCLPFLEQGALLLTANRRLSRHLRLAYGAYQRTGGRLAWESPRIVPWNAWMTTLWAEVAEGAFPGGGAPLPHRLSPVQEELLWLGLLSASSAGEGLLHRRGTAVLAMEAWSLLHQHLLPLPETWPEALLLGECRLFADWCRLFSARLRKGGWITAAQIPGCLLELDWPVPGNGVVIRAGFEVETPVQRRFLSHLEGRGVRTYLLEQPALASQAVHITCADEVAEHRLAAFWARERVEEGAGRVALLAPDLQARAADLRRALLEACLPGYLAGAEEGCETAPFEFSLGPPLSRQPLVRSVWSILKLLEEPLSFQAVSHLFLSPSIADQERELSARALLEIRWRQEAGDDPTLARLDDWLGRVGPDRVPALRQCLQKQRRWLQEREAFLQGEQPPGRWAAFFADWLRQWGWPGDRALSSEAFQAVQAFHEVLGVLSTLDAQSGPIGYADALELLHHLAEETPFQPEGREVPIQVMGLWEAEGLSFDAVWVLGLSEENWPPTASPNPFLPLMLQREHRLPRSTPQGEWQLAQRLTRRLMQAAPQVVFSHARGVEEQAVGISPLLASLPEVVRTLPTPFALQGVDPGVRLPRDADRAPAFADKRLPGGATLLARQAQCPFQAMARHRLGVQPLPPPSEGIEPFQRGVWIHELLQGLWRRLLSQNQLISYPEKALAALIEAEVERVVQPWRWRHDAFFLDLEAANLRLLASAWLEHERGRGGDFVLEACEREVVLPLAGRELSLRQDRVDRLPDGRFILLDYKTGELPGGGWFDDRPREAQLPAYVLAGPEPLAAIAHARLTWSRMGFHGLSEEEGLLPGCQPLERLCDGGWPEVAARWRVVLESLVEAFVSGEARVDPLPGSCLHCGLERLCRVGEGLEPEEGEESDE